MNEKELLRSMSEIKEEYVIDAAEALDNPESQNAQERTRVKVRKKPNWKVWAGGIAAALAVCIGIGAFAGGMGRSSSSYDLMTTESYYEPTTTTAYSGGSYSGMADMAVAEEAYDYAADTTSGSYENGSGAKSTEVQRSESKLIKRAYMTVQTLDFDESEAAIKALVESCGGYFESSNMYNGGIYDSDSYNKSADYTVRIPAENYNTFMTTVGDTCHITDINESVEDIGEEYFDVENRLKTLNTKLTRLLELLAKAENMTDIITIESEISDVEYEINSYTSTLNRYDSLVGYSTITISLYQVTRVDQGVQESNTFFARLWRSLKRGFNNFVNSIENFVNWAAYNLITIIIVVAAIIFIRKFHLIRRLLRLIKKY